MSRRARRLARAPAITHTTRMRVRFQEVDALRIVWHGHYLSYFETGREDFGEAHGLRYMDMHAAGVVAPVVEVSCHYHAPARYGDTLRVITRLHHTLAARLDFSFEIRRDADDTLLATGHSIQAFTTERGDLILMQPPLLSALFAREGLPTAPKTE